MKEQLVTFEVAKLAKEKGFDWIESDNKWYDNVGHPEVSSQGYHQEINSYRTSIPTQSLLQKWLREEHKISVTVFSSSQESWSVKVMAPIILAKTIGFPQKVS